VEVFFELFGVLEFLEEFGVGLEEFEFEELDFGLGGLRGLFYGVAQGVVIIQKRHNDIIGVKFGRGKQGREGGADVGWAGGVGGGNVGRRAGE
jgi:hypothetical protein